MCSFKNFLRSLTFESKKLLLYRHEAKNSVIFVTYPKKALSNTTLLPLGKVTKVVVNSYPSPVKIRLKFVLTLSVLGATGQFSPIASRSYSIFEKDGYRRQLYNFILQYHDPGLAYSYKQKQD